uniref:Protein TIC 20 n=1 Tax=Eucampia antarctica TaxID=49252 RepID=A0A7S2VYQ3_9STRA|mmetsp:Transcript_1101/g.1011  ORF Transcript_1101/g.1011 Transcript_1101/m.1011 type:complete len:235 (+) Transcript_1101:139-843(+)|eukprot:CAMPEP_0197829232 /NCGR_PEP_ID=MMETSP1437-20131217/5663_1 /TAXON_ID=49252 ORGANISM="Eucampia antarctica, Strain CCMP1452" /NCGR_SAMPLE_ID=MMETSP1437 /ASSEMBLY_ACC=CAM_ASM_001096 /LENGTH=234 /DNA_ID=CAMNT_0043430773 /DNA_START=28 /DNA_END=732 /DNA_ORIENTATION=-
MKCWNNNVVSLVLSVLWLLGGVCDGFMMPSSSSSLSSVHQSVTKDVGVVNGNYRRKNMELYIWGNRGDEDEGLELVQDRYRACIPYVLPLIDGDLFGKYIYQRIPTLGTLNEICLAPLVQSFHNIPFLGLILFLVLSLGTTRNYDMSRILRFNTQQAIMIDIALILPSILKDGMVDPDTGELYIPLTYVEPFYTTIYYAYMSCIIYSIYSNLRGNKPNQIPFLSSIAETTTGPF